MLITPGLIRDGADEHPSGPPGQGTGMKWDPGQGLLAQGSLHAPQAPLGCGNLVPPGSKIPDPRNSLGLFSLELGGAISPRLAGMNWFRWELGWDPLDLGISL